MYYQMPPRKRVHSYFLPFIVIIALFGLIVLAWWGLNRVLLGTGGASTNEKVFLNIEAGSAKAMTVGKSEWQNAPDRIYLYRGEGLKTASDGRATLTFFEQSIVRMNTSTEVRFASLKKGGDSFNIQMDVQSGDVWAKVNPTTNPDSKFSLTTDLLTVDSHGAVLSVSAPGTVFCLQGTAQIGVKSDDEVFKTFSLGVGQQFSVDPEKVASLRKGEEVEVIFALGDTFKQTNWYGWNAKKDGMIDAFEESSEPAVADESSTGSTTSTTTETTTGSTTSPTTGTLTNMDRVAYVTSPTQGFATNKSTVSVEGNFDSEKVKAVYVNGQKASVPSDGKWKMASVSLALEGENKIKLEAEDLTGVKKALESLIVVYDKTPPAVPVITEPKPSLEGAVDITSVEQAIRGTVSSDTQAVIVNDYRLGKYVPGSKSYEYWAKVKFGNLQAGENEFKIYAEDKAGNQSDPAEIVLKLDQKVIDEAGETTTESTTGATTGASTGSSAVSLPKASSTGGVKITAPNNGESFTTTETEFEIAGTVPAGTAKVSVNDYNLSLFQPGDSTFKYRAYKSIGNLVIGEKNTYTVKATDDSGALLGSASITIDVESGASADPVITMPTDAATYSTTLDSITLGGTVGKWVTRVYVNDKEITTYIPGSEKWSTTLKLQPGKNTYAVVGERNGEQTGKDSIEINLQ